MEIALKKLFLIIFITLSASFITACKQPSKQNDAIKKNSIKIAVIPKGSSHEFWKSIHAGAAKASKELKVEIIWKAPSKESDREEQIKIVEDFVNNASSADGISGIVISPADNMALRLPVKNAIANNVPVITIDSDLKSDDPLSFVATNNTQGGVLAARTLAKLVPANGKVIMLRYQVGQDSVTNREEGFLKTMSDEFPNIQVLSSNQYSGVTVETAYQAAENLLNTFKDAEGKLNIDGIFAPCEPVAFGMLRALQELQLAGSVKLVGFDSSEKLSKALEDGQISALILQDPVGMAYQGVKLMLDHLQGKEIPKIVDTGVFVVDQQNMNQPELKILLKPEIDKWLS